MRILGLIILGILAACSANSPDSTMSGGNSELREPDVRYEPTPQPVVEAMLKLGGVGPSDVVYDLGSGDGRIPITAATKFGGRGVGIDIDPRRIRESNANASAAGVADRVQFRNEDLFAADFHDATVVTLFLQPDLNLKLKPRLLAQLRPGSRIVSYYHDMGNWQPDRQVATKKANIYLWIVPERPGSSK